MRSSLVRRTVALVAAVVVSSGLVAGCTGGGSDDDKKRPKSSATPSVLEVNLAKPLVEETFQVGENDTVTVGILGLEYDDNIQVLHMVFTPHFTSRNRDSDINLSTMLTGDKYSSADLTPRLVDRKNLKVYYPVDNYKTGGGNKTVNGHPMYVYAVFATPEDDDRVYEVRITDSWLPFVDVESVESER